MMRIITGRARGTKLNTLEGLNTRPTSERTKEAIFSMIQFEVAESKNVLDLFAGSGQMGLEALSRGALKATFVDRERDAISVIKQNVTKTRFENNSMVVMSEFEEFLNRVANKEKYDLIFLDPPYASEFIIKATNCLIRNKLLKNNAIVVCESQSFDFIETNIIKENFKIIKQSKYGIAYVAILKYLEISEV